MQVSKLVHTGQGERDLFRAFLTLPNYVRR